MVAVQYLGRAPAIGDRVILIISLGQHPCETRGWSPRPRSLLRRGSTSCRQPGGNNRRPDSPWSPAVSPLRQGDFALCLRKGRGSASDSSNNLRTPWMGKIFPRIASGEPCAVAGASAADCPQACATNPRAAHAVREPRCCSRKFPAFRGAALRSINPTNREHSALVVAGVQSFQSSTDLPTPAPAKTGRMRRSTGRTVTNELSSATAGTFRSGARMAQGASAGLNGCRFKGHPCRCPRQALPAVERPTATVASTGRANPSPNGEPRFDFASGMTPRSRHVRPRNFCRRWAGGKGSLSPANPNHLASIAYPRAVSGTRAAGRRLRLRSPTVRGHGPPCGSNVPRRRAFRCNWPRRLSAGALPPAPRPNRFRPGAGAAARTRLAFSGSNRRRVRCRAIRSICRRRAFPKRAFRRPEVAVVDLTGPPRAP